MHFGHKFGARAAAISVPTSGLLGSSAGESTADSPPVRVEERGTETRGARDTASAPAQALPSHGLVRWRGRPSPASGCRVSRRDKGRPLWPAAGCPAEGLEEQEHGVLRMARRRLGRGRRALLRRKSRGILRESAYQSHDYRRRDAVAVVLVLPEARRSCQKDPHPTPPVRYRASTAFTLLVSYRMYVQNMRIPAKLP